MTAVAMGSVSGRVIPPLTVRMARASNPRGTAAMWVRDRLDGLFTDADFADWYPADGRRGMSPAQLALVSVLQYAENLTDRQAAEAVRCRLDWKYCLGLELDDPGFDFTVLSEFRGRVAEGDRADRFLALVVDRLAEAGLVKRRGQIRTDSTHVLAAVRRLNRGELVAETLRCALEDLALQGEEWLAALVTADWADRYGRPVRYDRLPRGGDALIAWVLQVGEDGLHILRAVYQDDAPPALRELRSVQVMRQVWVQQYWHDEAGRLRWRAAKSTRDRAGRRATGQRNTGKTSADGRPDPASVRVPWSSVEIVTPHDPEARYNQKVTAAGQRDWIGYRDHQTETCDETSPTVTVQVVTRPAPQQNIRCPRRHPPTADPPGLSAPRARRRRRLRHTGQHPPRGPHMGHPAARPRSVTTRRPPSGRASRRKTSTSTGTTAPSPVRTASPARPGNPPWATGIPGCPFSSPARHAGNATTA
ncbi:transposase [Streptomyces sp. NPDC006872]|uniref:transposase n=1 Tax=Streptomyces sp. NPDC006872 TaxID=3155720 RepID=UPI003402A0BB